MKAFYSQLYIVVFAIERNSTLYNLSIVMTESELSVKVAVHCKRLIA